MTTDTGRRRLIANSLMFGGVWLMTKPSYSAILADKTMENTSHDKQWAKRHLRGGENFIFPSMNKDLTTINEAGVRADVQHAAAQGFCSVMPLTLGINPNADQHMREIIKDEANGKINTVGIIRPGSWQEKQQSIRSLEAQGNSHALIYFSPALASQDAIFEQMREIIENTSLGIILYAKPSDDITHLDPTGLPLDAFNKLADLPNVIGIKFTQELRPATAMAIAQRLSDRLLLGVVDLEMMLVLAEKYPMQWTGQWGIDSLQSPTTPWVNQFLAFLREGKTKQAEKLYWQYEKIATPFYELQAPLLAIGGHPWLHIKYMQWLTGGNGGLLPNLDEPISKVPPLDKAARKRSRKLFERVGIETVNLPDEAFVVGNSLYQLGIRIKDLPDLPQYVVE